MMQIDLVILSSQENLHRTATGHWWVLYLSEFWQQKGIMEWTNILNYSGRQ